MVYGKSCRLVIYTNMARAQRERDQRNEAVAKVGEALDKLAKEGAEWSEAKLHEKIGGIVGSWGEFVKVRVSRKGEGSRVTGRLHQ